MDSRSPRDGRVIEELGHYDPMVPDTDARVVLKRERVDYWLSVGALPTPKVSVLIRKYGSGGTHLEKNEEALQQLAKSRQRRGPVTIAPTSSPAAETEPAAEAVEERPVEETAAATETAEAEASESPEEKTE